MGRGFTLNRYEWRGQDRTGNVTDIVVVGGGYVGLFAAADLANRGAHVVLVERGLPGAANSINAPGGIRRQFGTEINIRLAQLSGPTWDDFETRFGVDPLFQNIGYLFLARSEPHSADLARNVALQNSLGVDSELLDADEIGRRWPMLRGRGFAAAGFRQADGWANQHRIVDGLVRGCLALGVDLRVGTEVQALRLVGGRVTGVHTSAGPIAADVVLLATGAWSLSLLDGIGPALPVVARRHELLLVEPPRPYPARTPWLIGVDDGVHTRVDVDGLALVGGFLGQDLPVDPDTYDPRADPSWTRGVLEIADRVFGLPGSGARVHRGWAGLYPGTPDRHPIIDRVADGIFVALGFGGTGLMLAPAAGQLATELIFGGALESISGRGLSATRFGDIQPSETTGF